MKFSALGAYYQQQLATIRTLVDGQSLWAQDAAAFLARAAQDAPTTDALMQLMHEAQRLNRVAVAGLGHNAAFRQAVLAEAPAIWKDFGAPPVSRDLQISLAQKIYNAKPGQNDAAIILLGAYAREMGPWLLEKCQADGIPFVVQFEDPVFNPLSLNHADDAGVQALAADMLTMTTGVTKRMIAATGMPMKEITADKDKSSLYRKSVKPFSDKISSGEVFFTLTAIPTPRDAQIDGIPYADYIKLFFEMCDQPWDHIDKAQQELIREFNAAKSVRITNNDGTDISMDIDGYTFCNSLIAKNVPGSEIFSAPRRDSVEGKIVAKGRFEREGIIIENLTLEFNKGKLVKYSADQGLQAFEKAISIDEGAIHVGELGIGTNPHLKKHVTNTLLVEKIGGSFHVALGNAYTMKEYAGVPVNVDNGNKSMLHWDITTMLAGKQGRIYLDGRLIMDDGRFLDLKYDVLNRGWEAVPEQDRPDYWKAYYKNPQP